MDSLNGGFPPLIIKKIDKISNNKERFAPSTIKNNISIRQILKESKNDKSIIEKKDIKEELDIITSL